MEQALDSNRWALSCRRWLVINASKSAHRSLKVSVTMVLRAFTLRRLCTPASGREARVGQPVRIGKERSNATKECKRSSSRTCQVAQNARRAQTTKRCSSLQPICASPRRRHQKHAQQKTPSSAPLTKNIVLVPSGAVSRALSFNPRADGDPRPRELASQQTPHTQLKLPQPSQ